MPHQFKKSKRVLSARIPRELYAKIKKQAKLRGEAMSDFVLATLTIATKNVNLTPEEIEQIRKDTENAK